MAGEIGYQTVAEAAAYFATRLAATAWTSIVDDSGQTTKTAALQTAYDRLYYCGLWALPTLATATAAQLVILKKAQAEMSLYLLIHLADEDRRKGLHAQGVVGANIVGETYARFVSDQVSLTDVPIPPLVKHMLDAAGFSTAGSGFYVADIDRDEEESANTDVSDF